jgi:hypothetical protein
MIRGWTQHHAKVFGEETALQTSYVAGVAGYCSCCGVGGAARHLTWVWVRIRVQNLACALLRVEGFMMMHANLTHEPCDRYRLN